MKPSDIRRIKLREWFASRTVPAEEKSYISQLINGKASFGEKAARRLENSYGMPSGFLDTQDEAQKITRLTKDESPRVPLISYVQAGLMSEAVTPYSLGDAVDYLLTDLELSESAFALEIRGESMLPDFKEGDRIVIDPAIEPMPGDFIVAKNGDEEATFKKYRPRGKYDENGNAVFDLLPLNPDYPPMHSDIVPLKIIGTMVEHRRYRKK